MLKNISHFNAPISENTLCPSITRTRQKLMDFFDQGSIIILIITPVLKFISLNELRQWHL